MQPQQPFGSPQSPKPDYDFIFNPSAPRKRPGLPGSPAKRIGVVLAGLLVLLVVFLVVKSALSGPSNYDALVAVAQQQQSIIHLAANGAQHPGSAQNTKNFAITTQLSLASEQTDLLTYLKQTGKRVDPKVLTLKVSPALDSQLSAAAGTYDSTFKSIMQDQLTGYEQAISKAYSLTSGPRGKALLNDDYKAAKLLLTQLASPAS